MTDTKRRANAEQHDVAAWRRITLRPRGLPLPGCQRRRRPEHEGGLQGSEEAPRAAGAGAVRVASIGGGMGRWHVKLARHVQSRAAPAFDAVHNVVSWIGIIWYRNVS